MTLSTLGRAACLWGVVAALLCSIAACADSVTSDPLIRKAYDALDEAYVIDVKPASASRTQCSYGIVDSRHAVRCGISFGGAQLAQVGYWEIERQGEAFVIYAMNGKALSALDRINSPGARSTSAYPGVFKSGAGRPPFNIEKINEVIK